MEDYFSFLPGADDGIMFVDSSGLEVIRKGRGRDPSFNERLIKGYGRLSLLTKKLSNMENWVTIKEVAEEFKDGIRGLEEVKGKRSARNMAQLLERGIRLRKRTYKLLAKEERNAANSLPTGAARRINEILLPKAEKLFQRVGGELGERNTDCKLVVNALAFAGDIPVYMFSYDSALLATYSILAKRLGQTIEKTYIIDEMSKKWENEKTFSTLKYYDWKGLKKFDW